MLIIYISQGASTLLVLRSPLCASSRPANSQNTPRREGSLTRIVILYYIVLCVCVCLNTLCSPLSQYFPLAVWGKTYQHYFLCRMPIFAFCSRPFADLGHFVNECLFFPFCCVVSH